MGIFIHWGIFLKRSRNRTDYELGVLTIQTP